VRGVAHPVVCNAVRNSWVRNGWPAASAFQSEGEIPEQRNVVADDGRCHDRMGVATKGTGERLLCIGSPIVA
jgi:hypothetical protein